MIKVRVAFNRRHKGPALLNALRLDSFSGRVIVNSRYEYLSLGYGYGC